MPTKLFDVNVWHLAGPVGPDGGGDFPRQALNHYCAG
jgi:hypothetical protein